MASDVNKLVIAIETKGATKTKTELDKVVTSSKNMATQAEKTTKKQAKFTTAMGTFRSELPNVASGVYLLQQAYSFLSSAVGVVTDAYAAQYSAEVKLQTILASTSNAIGMTYNEVYSLSQAWEDMTGVNDSVILNAEGIMATFTQISSTVFPQAIEQALNMSTIFGQDLQQSVIQLGTALNDPVAGVGRLRRIGISFTPVQKEMINNFVAMGDKTAATGVIIDELEHEIGAVARAMGESSLGKIKKFNNAWTNMFEEVGEKATNFWADVLDETKAQQAVENITEILSNSNDREAVKKAFAMEELTDEDLQKMIPLNALQGALADLENQLMYLPPLLPNSVDEGGKLFRAELKAEEERIKKLINTFAADAKWDTLTENMKLLYGDPQADILSPDASKFLASLKAEYDIKNNLLTLDETGAKYEKAKQDEISTYNTIMSKGLALGIKEKDLEEALQGYTSKRILALKEEEEATRLLAVEKQTAADKALLRITDEQEETYNLVQYANQLATAVKENGMSAEDARVAMTAYKESLKETKEEMQEITAGSFGDILAAQLKSPFSDLDDIIDWEATYTGAIDSVYNSLGSLADSALSTSLEAIGAALYEGSDAAADWEEAMQTMVASSLSAIGPQLMLAGASQLAQTAGESPMGWALLAAGGAASIYGGYLSAYLGGSDSDSDTTYVYTGTDSTDSVESDEYEADTISKGMTVNITNNASATVSTTSTTASDGSKVLDVVLDAVESKYAVTTRTVSVGTK